MQIKITENGKEIYRFVQSAKRNRDVLVLIEDKFAIPGGASANLVAIRKWADEMEYGVTLEEI